jgi:SAM-dependent methyltransferase
MVDKETVRRGYDEVAETYAADREEDGREREILARFIGELPDSARVLDAGCGGGTPVLADLSESVTAVGTDISRTQLDLAADAVPDAALAQGDMAALPFRDGAFDAVTAFHSLIHVPRDQHRSVVDEFGRALADGGRVLLSEGIDEWRGTNPDWPDGGVEMEWHIAGADATRDHLRDVGFTVEAERNAADSLDDGNGARWAFFAARLTA